VFARLTGLTRKALKTYERYGLLQPADIDPFTRYRSYSLQQVRTAETIRLLRSVGVSLREVGAALRADEATPLALLLARRRQQLAEELAATDRLLERLRSVDIEPLRGVSTQIAVREVPEHFDLVCPARCNFETHEVTVDRLLERIAGLLSTHGLEPLGRETATYHADFDLTRDFRVEVSVPVDLSQDGEASFPPSCRRVPAACAASALHWGPYGEMHTTSACLIGWVADHDLPLSGWFSETYLVDERDTDDPDSFCTQISLGVAAAPPVAP
jgi:DNA-binding transcriptional MerR regulator